MERHFALRVGQAWRLAPLDLQRPLHSTKQPADAERHDRRCIGLGFDCSPQPFVKGRSRIAPSDPSVDAGRLRRRSFG